MYPLMPILSLSGEFVKREHYVEIEGKVVFPMEDMLFSYR